MQPTNIPQRIVGNLNYILPFGHGQKIGGNLPGWQNQLVGGWKLNFIGFVQSGYALGITQTGGAAYSGSRPSFVPGVNPLTSGGIPAAGWRHCCRPDAGILQILRHSG